MTLKRFFGLWKDRDFLRMLAVTAVIFAAMSVLRPQLFLREANFTSMGYQIPELGFYSLAMMMVMITGGRDLSIVSIGNLCCIVAAYIMHGAVEKGVSGPGALVYILAGIAAALAVGALCGLVNGLVVANFSVPPMLVTMATSSIFMGIGIILTEGKTVSKTPEAFIYLGNHTLLGLPYMLWLLILTIFATAVILNRTRFGFEVRMVGSNARASHFTGINVSRVLVKTYLYSGIVCALCGLEILARTDTAKSDYALTYTFQAILCAVLGATNPNGGFAKISCMVLSLAALQFLSSGFNMLRLGGYFKEFTWGLLLIVVLSLEYLSQELKRKQSLRQTAKHHQKDPQG